MKESSLNGESLIQEGWDYLDAGAFFEAEEIADQLIEKNVASGYRMKAMCQVGEDDWNAALASLDAGVKQFPQDWELHLMRGNFLSENEDFDGALAAFEQALACPDVRPDWILLNKAVIHSKKEEYERALEICQSIKDPELKLQVLEVEFRVLGEMNRPELILNTAQERLEDLPDVEDESAAAVLSRIFYYVASASWAQEQGEEKTLEYLWASIDYDRTNPHALWLLREMRSEYSESAKTFKILAQGRFKAEEEAEAETFFTSYEVVADNMPEALEMIREFEVEDVDTDYLEVLQFEEEPNEPDHPKGIYEVGPFGFVGI